MRQTFATRELAEAARDKAIENLRKCETIGGRFCPLINGACVTRCVCFGMPHISGSHEWNLYEHHCTNEMFEADR